RRLVGPVPVLEDQHQRMVPGQPLEEAARGPEDLTSDGLAIEVPDAAVELPLDAEADQRREPGQEVRGFVDEQGLREPLELRPRLIRAILVGDAGCRADQLAERPVAGALPERR